MKLDLDAVTSLVQRELGEGKVLVPVEEEDQEEQQGQEELEDDMTIEDRQEAALNLMSSLSEAREVVSILELMAFADPSIISAKHAVLAVRQMAKDSKIDSEKKGQDPFFQSFLQTVRDAFQRDTPRPQEVSTLLWAISRLRQPLPLLQDLLLDVAPYIPEAAADMDLGNLTSSLASVAKLHKAEPELCSAVEPLMSEIIRQADSLTASQVAGTIWAAGELVGVTEQAASVPNTLLSGRDPGAFTNAELANLLWGLANLSWRSEIMLLKVVQVLRERAASMTTKEAKLDVPMILCALARMRFDDVELFDAVTAALLQQRVSVLKRMNDWSICALAWSWPDSRDGDLCRGKIRAVRMVVDHQLRKRRLNRVQIERSRLGPNLWAVDPEDDATYVATADAGAV